MRLTDANVRRRKERTLSSTKEIGLLWTRILTLLAVLPILAPSYAGGTQRDLIEAARTDDAKTVQKLINEGADVNAKDEQGWSALMHAADQGHQAILELLLAQGADVNVKDQFGRTALSRAAVAGHPTTVQLLERAGASLDASAPPLQSYARLIEAAAEDDVDAVQALLAEGASANWNVDGYTPLMEAAREGQIGALRALLKEGANINAKNLFGMTSLMGAAGSGHNWSVVPCGTVATMGAPFLGSAHGG